MHCCRKDVTGDTCSEEQLSYDLVALSMHTNTQQLSWDADEAVWQGVPAPKVVLLQGSFVFVADGPCAACVKKSALVCAGDRWCHHAGSKAGECNMSLVDCILVDCIDRTSWV
jgi:hypothetical protein